jgi:hypothetical protein
MTVIAQKLEELAALIGTVDHDDEDLDDGADGGCSDHEHDYQGNLTYDARCFRCKADRILTR